MNIVYQIKTKDGVAYASNIAACDELCAKMIKSGIYPRVRRMKRSAVPLSHIEIVNKLR